MGAAACGRRQLQAIAPGAPVIHASLGDNVAFDFTIEKGDPAKAFAEADFVIEEELRFERQTAMTLEARGPDRRFQPGRRLAQCDALASVAVPDAAHLQQAPGHSRASCARCRAGRRRRLRHEAQHLQRRDRYRGGEHDPRPAREILRRPAGILRLRCPCARSPHQVPHCREEVRRDPGDGDGRYRRDRRLRHAACASMSPKA